MRSNTTRDGRALYTDYLQRTGGSGLDALGVPEIIFTNWNNYNNAFVEERGLILSYDPEQDAYIVWGRDFFPESFMEFLEHHQRRHVWVISVRCYDSIENKVETW